MKYPVGVNESINKRLKIRAVYKTFLNNPYVMIKEKQVFDDADARRAAMRAVASSTFDEQPSIDERDGLRLDFNEGWVHVRQSGTEPALRFIGESTDREWILNTVATMKRAAENT